MTLGQKIVVYIWHAVITVLVKKGGHWLSPSCMLKYQTVLREQEYVELKVTTVVNPAQFLYAPMQEEQLTHDCLQTIEQVYASQPDLQDIPTEDPEIEFFTDVNSFMQDGR